MSKQGCYIVKSAEFYITPGAYRGFHWSVKDEGDDGVLLSYHDEHVNDTGVESLGLPTEPAALRKMGEFLVEIANLREQQDKELRDA